MGCERVLDASVAGVLAGKRDGVVDGVAEESRDWEARVRTRSDASQRHVHVQARAQCPTPEGPEERSKRDDAQKGSRDSLSFHWFCVNVCGRRLWD